MLSGPSFEAGLVQRKWACWAHTQDSSRSPPCAGGTYLINQDTGHLCFTWQPLVPSWVPGTYRVLITSVGIGTREGSRTRTSGFLWDAGKSLDPPHPQDGQQPALQILRLLQNTHDQARLLRLLPVPPAALLPLGQNGECSVWAQPHFTQRKIRGAHSSVALYAIHGANKRVFVLWASGRRSESSLSSVSYKIQPNCWG